MNAQKSSAEAPDWKKSFLWLALAVACFHAAYVSIKHPAAGLFIFGYALGLVKLADQPNVRRAFYFTSGWRRVFFATRRNCISSGTFSASPRLCCG